MNSIRQLNFEKWHELSDTNIWDAFRAGNHDALAYMYNTYVRDMYNYGYQVHPDEELVKDGIQEVFINLWRNRENLTRSVTIKYYLFKALRHQLLKYVAIINKGQHEHLTPTTENIIWENDHEHHLIDNEFSREKNQILNSAIGQLPDRQREVIYLIFYKNIPYEEAADILSINLSSVYTLVWKAIKKLKKQLKYFEVLIFLLLPLNFL